MSQLTNEDVKRIAKLACIEVNDESCKILAAQAGSTISWMKQLDEINVDNIEPLTNVNNQNLRMMPDIINDGNIVDDILRNTNNAKYNYFSVPKVIE